MKVKCPDCREQFNVPDEYKGKMAKCPVCKGCFILVELAEAKNTNYTKEYPFISKGYGPDSSTNSEKPDAVGSSTKHCHNCGKTLEVAMKFCVKCGAKQSSEGLETNNQIKGHAVSLPQDSLPKTNDTKSRILWFTLLGWSIVIFLLLVYMISYYQTEIARTRWPPDREPIAAAEAFWILLLSILWFIGALPLFISAVVTRKKQ